jgi:hypothetical protein
MIRIGTQGELGSTNERAAKHFALKQRWASVEVKPLRITKRVLAALHQGTIGSGTFAYESS